MDLPLVHNHHLLAFLFLTINLQDLFLELAVYDFVGIELLKTATVGELKMAVEAAFSHLPITGVGKVSWYEDSSPLVSLSYM